MFLFIIKNRAQAELAVKLYKKYSSFIYTIAFDILKDKELSEDAVQSALVKLIDGIEKIDPADTKKTRNYIGVIARTTAIDIYKERKTEAAPLTEVLETIANDVKTAETAGAETKAAESETIREIYGIISRLDDKYRIPISLKMQGYTPGEIAAALDIEVKTAQKRIERARAKIREELKAYE